MKIEKPENYKYYTFAKDGKKELYLYAENKLLMTKGTGFIRVPFSDIENKWEVLTKMPGAMAGFVYHARRDGRSLPSSMNTFIKSLTKEQKAVLDEAIAKFNKEEEAWEQETKRLEEAVAKRRAAEKEKMNTTSEK